jgi:uncharacterized damage-inducible protein DinB
MTTARTDPPYVAGERQMLEAWLDCHRATLAFKCEGLSARQLAQRSAPPSNLSLLGLVRHMAEVERGWFRRNLGQQDVPDIYCTEADPDADFNHVDSADALEAFAAWRKECDQARAGWRRPSHSTPTSAIRGVATRCPHGGSWCT